MMRGFPIVLLLLLVLPACGQTPSEFRPLTAALGDLRGVALGFEGLLPLGEGEGTYSAFLSLDDGDIVGLGGFNVNDSGRPIDGQGNVIDRFTADRNLFSSVSLVVSVEQGAIGSSPSQATILQGPFINGIASLSVPSPLFISDASGSYRVFTPTDGPSTHEGSGAWAVSVAGEATLTLPPLNNLYLYEHFMVINGMPITMGRFSTAGVADFANPWSGPLEAPAFPGEDFLANAPQGFTFPADLSGAQLLVTLEPILNDTVLPFQLVILQGTLPAAIAGGEIIELTNRSANFPTGTAIIF
ncbi:MAG: hypothetical protein IH849_05035 [Acidobacteria bacterium]|nr:hypothetical protein [Acidobacteriota bacterium]